MKGKGYGSSFHLRSRSAVLRGRPVVTRLTRTMGFVEMSQSSGAPGSQGSTAETDPELPDSLPTPH
jgi:hypothetical protein